jgi:hypothetical protein
MDTTVLTASWVTLGNVLGILFLVAVFLARTVLKAKNHRDLEKKL